MEVHGAVERVRGGDIGGGEEVGDFAGAVGVGVVGWVWVPAGGVDAVIVAGWPREGVTVRWVRVVGWALGY